MEKNAKKIVPNAKKELEKKNDAKIEIRLERKYLVDYSAMSRDAQRKFRGDKRNKLWKIVDKFYLAEKRKDTKGMEEAKKLFAEFSKLTYCNVDYSQREIFFNGKNEGNNISKIENLNLLLKAMQGKK